MATATAVLVILAMPAKSGVDAVCVDPPPATIFAQPGVVTSGTPGNDVIHGTPGDDRIAGLGGNDVLVGFGGNDQLSGGDGEDTLCGGDGQDQLVGGAGNDQLFGDAGNDDLAGGLGNDQLLGGTGVDRLSGGEGVDGCGPGGEVGDAAAPAPSCDTLITTTTTSTSTTATSTSTTSTTLPGSLATPPVIYLGFADTFHDNDGTKPSYTPLPWRGDPSVVFVGCSGSECGGTSNRISAGAIRIDNVATNTNPMTLVAASVDIGPCHFEPWGALLPQTASPGQSLVLTQTGVLGPPLPGPCNLGIDPLFWPELNFFTSLRPGDTRSPSSYSCNPDIRHTPVINLTFADGTVLAVSDAGRILNTGGVNHFACTSQDQATPWTGPIPY